MKLKDDSILLHGGQTPDPTTGSRAVPIYQTTSYNFKNAEHGMKSFDCEANCVKYKKINNLLMKK